MPDPAPTPRLDTVLPTVTVDQLLALQDAVVVDLRSPAEHADDRVPGAASVPLFDDVERAIVGTLYKRASPEAAFRAGLDRVRRGVGELVARIAELAGWEAHAGGPEALAQRVDELTADGVRALEQRLRCEPLARPPERPVVLHCWRGGMRSRSVLALVRRLGLERAVGLEGGYKAYRQRVQEDLARWEAPPAFVLRGLTGVGKTRVLNALERLRPGWTLDLEGCAGHRGSLLGMVGLEPCSQRAFESRLAARWRAGLGPVLVLEGESRKVGDRVVPARVWETLCGGTSLLLEAPVERRVALLAEDYLARPEARGLLRRQLAAVEARMQRPRDAEPLVALLDAERVDELVRALLAEYYDPLYRRSERGQRYAARFDASDAERCAFDIARWIDARQGA